MDITGKTALITGSNRGIGREIVKAFVAGGARKVYATARDPAGVRDLVAAHPGVIDGLALDITNPDQVAQAAHWCGDVEILVNNAGINRLRGFIAADNIEAAQEEMAVNYFGTLAMCRAFAPILEQNGGGAIVTQLSVLARICLPLMGSLCASKAAGFSMMQGVRAELAAQKTLVIVMMPGAVDTDMSRNFPPPKMPPEDVAQAVIEALNTETEEVYPGEMAGSISRGLVADPKTVERQFAQLLPQ